MFFRFVKSAGFRLKLLLSSQETPLRDHVHCTLYNDTSPHSLTQYYMYINYLTCFTLNSIVFNLCESD